MTVDEEQFRLLTRSFNHIFVSIAAAILSFAVAWIGHPGRLVSLGLSILMAMVPSLDPPGRRLL